MKKILTVMVLWMFIVPVMLFASGQEESNTNEPVTIRMSSWLATEGASRDTIMKMLDMFEEKHPNVNVELINIPYAQTQQQIIVSSSAGNAPDVMQLVPTFSVPLASMGVLKDLSGYYTEEELGDIPTAALDAGYFDDKLLTVPWQIAPISVLANKALLKKAGLEEKIPETWPDFMQATEKISKMSDDIYGFGARSAKNSNTAFWFLPVLWGLGGEFETDGEVNLNSPETVRAFNWFKEIGTKKYIPVGMSIPETRNLFSQDKIGFVFDGPWMKGIIRSASGLGEEADDKYIIGPFPVGTDGIRHAIANNHVFAVSSKSKVADEAIALIKFLTQNEEATKLYYKNNGAIPTYRSLLADPLYQNDSFVKVFVDASEYAENLPSKNPNLTTALEEMATSLQEVMLGADPSSAVKKLDKKVQGILE